MSGASNLTLVALGLCLLIVIVVIFRRSTDRGSSAWMRLALILLGCSGAMSSSLMLFSPGRELALMLGLGAMLLAATSFWCLYRAKRGY
jgi:hypothetical protein